MAGKHGTLIERFWRFVIPGKRNECWEWKGAIDGETGYGRIHGGPSAHRLSYEIFRARILPGFCVCHVCDNRKCVNPSHLFLASIADNNRDMWDKGRGRITHHKGDRNGSAILTAEAVVIIRQRKMLGHSVTDMAREYGVSTSTIYAALKGDNWKWLK